MKSFVGMILGIIGGVLSLILSFIFIVISIFIFIGKGTLVEYGLSPTLIDFANSLGFWMIFLGLWFLIFGFMGVIFSSMMNEVEKTRRGGVYCLICGVLSVNLFLIVGGIMGIISGEKISNFKTVETQNWIREQSTVIKK